MNRAPTSVLVAITVVLFGTVVLVGCGGSAPTPADAQVSKLLGAQVARVRAAAETRDIFTATARLDDLRRSVFVLRAHGDLSAAAANRILAAADHVQTDLPLVAPTTATTAPTTTPTSTTTATSVPKSTTPAKRHHDKGHGGGSG